MLTFFGALLLGGGPGCSPVPARAPFPYVPSSVIPGSLEGPFSGRVVAAGTGKPIEDAVVYATWEYASGVGVRSPSGYREFHGKTNADGRYKIPKVDKIEEGYPQEVEIRNKRLLVAGRGGFGSGRGQLRGFRLLIYKRGYVAYRSDRLFESGAPRIDFAQHNIVIRLQRWSSELSRVEHARFIGAVRRLGKVAAWELHAAQAELEGRTTEPISPKPLGLLDASALLDEDDIKELFGNEGPFEVTRLKSHPQTATTDSRHFKAAGKEETYDLAYRVWKLDAHALPSQYAKLLKTYPSSRPVDQVGDRSFVAGNKKISAHVFADNRRQVIVSITCGVKLCKTEKSLTRAALLVYGRLSKLRVGSPTPVKSKPLPDIRLDPYRDIRAPRFIPRLNP